MENTKIDDEFEDVSPLKSGEYVRKTPDTVIKCAIRQRDFHH